MVTKVETEEVCNECGSTNIGYDAWVKRIGGELEIVGGPYDRCICLTDSCSRYENETVGRLVLVQNLRDCDGQDCYYNGDKDVMTSNPMNPVTKEEPYKYWYCSNCKESLMTLAEKLEEWAEEDICVACGGDDVTCEEDCTLHKCVDCNYVQENREKNN